MAYTWHWLPLTPLVGDDVELACRTSVRACVRASVGAAKLL